MPLARKCVGTSKDPKDVKMRTKFEEASWRMCVYAATCAWAAYVTIPNVDSMPWLTDSMELMEALGVTVVDTLWALLLLLSVCVEAD